MVGYYLLDLPSTSLAVATVRASILDGEQKGGSIL
jgi:hypothetical protein